MPIPVSEEPPALPKNADALPSRAEPIFGPRRTRIRDDLRAFLRASKLSHREFAEVLSDAAEVGITTNDSAIRRLLNPNASRVSHDVVLAIETYLNKHFRSKPEDPTPPSVSLFEVARAFFRMREYKVQQYHQAVTGIYRLHAYSESGRGKSVVCLGAIRFNEDFSAEELQTWTMENGHTIREEFEGHYLYRGDSLVALLRNKKEKEPKFYILAIPNNETDESKKETLTGLLLKTGDGRLVFGATIHMIRNESAFKGTNVVPRKNVDAAILRILDSDQWLPRSAKS